MPEDPFARLAAAADKLSEALASSEPPAPEPVRLAARSLEREIARAARAERSRRSAALRGALDDVDRRALEQQVASERAEHASRLDRLSAEVEVLLLPTRDAARALYVERSSALLAALTQARALRAAREAELAAAPSEMERARGAAQVALEHDRERALELEAADVARKLGALGSG